MPGDFILYNSEFQRVCVHSPGGDAYELVRAGLCHGHVVAVCRGVNSAIHCSVCDTRIVGAQYFFCNCCGYYACSGTVKTCLSHGVCQNCSDEG